MESEGEQTEAVETQSFTQADLDKVVQTRLGKAQSKYEETLQAKENEMTELRESLQTMEQKLEQKEAEKAGQGEAYAAISKRMEAMEKELRERDERIAQQRQAEIVGNLDGADKTALLEAGFNPKYADHALSMLAKSRIVEGESAIYKDAEGAAIDRSEIISSLVSEYPELVLSNRAKGNNVATGAADFGAVDPSKETAAQYIARKEAERAGK